MSKAKRSGGKPVSHKRTSRGTAASEPAPEPPVETPVDSTDFGPRRPPGQRLWDMPYSASAPRMINPGIGLHNLVARAGHNAGYDIDLTLLDAPDHRLIRSGVLLAHRVLDGRGEWYLGAPDWVPLLPKERIDPMSQADLPEELADLVRPFRRRATLGPVAALRCERREFALRDDRGTTMALLRDDKVTVRRGGLTTARYREVMLTPIGPGLSEEQDFWLRQVLGQAGATLVDRFPRLVTRLGAPSNGLTDFPVPAPLNGSPTFAAFVTVLLTRRLRQLLEADLAIRSDGSDGAAEMAEHAEHLQRELHALSPVLDETWIDDLDDELSWVVDLAQREQAARSGLQDGATAGNLKARLRSERYLSLLERLVTSARAPRTGTSGGRPALDVLDELLAAAGRRLTTTAGRMAADPSASAWDSSRAALDDLLQLCDVVEQLQPGRFDHLRSRLEVIRKLLSEASRQAHLAQLTKELAVDSPALEAFELGRRYEHELIEARAAREAFGHQWSKTAKKLGPMLAPPDS